MRVMKYVCLIVKEASRAPETSMTKDEFELSKITTGDPVGMGDAVAGSGLGPGEGEVI